MYVQKTLTQHATEILTCVFTPLIQQQGNRIAWIICPSTDKWTVENVVLVRSMIFLFWPKTYKICSKMDGSENYYVKAGNRVRKTNSAHLLSDADPGL